MNRLGKTSHYFVLVTFSIILSFGQTERWVYRYSGVNQWQDDRALSIVYGLDFVYAAGRTWQQGASGDFTVISLSNFGAEHWVYAHNGFAGYDDQANALVYGNDGNIYAAGECYGDDTTMDFTVISLDPDGIERWVHQYNGPSGGHDYARSITYGADDNLYVAGYDYRFNSGYDFFVMSLTNAGNVRWSYRYNESGNHPDEAYSITYGGDGNIYAAGMSDFNSAVVVSLTNAGTERWVYHYHQHFEDYAYSVIYSENGYVYVTGVGVVQIGIEMLPRLFVICLSDSGIEQWVYEHSTPSSAYIGTYDADGNFYVTGAYGTDFAQFMVLCITDSGTLGWEYYIPVDYFGHGMSIVYGLDSNIYATGELRWSYYDYNFAIVSLTNNGEERWLYQYDRGGWDAGLSVCYAADNNIYAVGMSTDAITGIDFTVISLDPSTGIEEEVIVPSEKNNRHATITSGPLLLPESKFCKVFDITGRVVTPDKMKPGIYFIEMDGEIQQKIIKIR